MKLKPYPRYKPSGVEWLADAPEGWTSWRLRFGVALNPSKSEITNLDRDTEVSFLPMEAIGDDGTIDLRRTRPISEVETGYTYFRDGDVTIAKITPCFENGKGARMLGLMHAVGFGTTELIVARPNERLDGEFLHWLFVSEPFRKQGEAHMYGAGGQKRVPDDFVRNFDMAWPPYEEQSAIATFLDRETDKIDTLIAKQEKLIELLQEKRQAVISHAVTKGLDPTVPVKPSGVEWLGEVPEHWNPVTLGRLCKQVSDGPHFSPSYVDDGVMFISARNIKVNGWALDDAKYISQEDYLEFCKRVIPEIGDVLYTKGGTTGIARVVDLQEPFQVWVHVAVLKVRGEVANPYYVAYALNSVGCFEQSQLFTRGATNQDLGLTRMTQIWMVLPPLSEQRDIVKYLDQEAAKIDTLIAKAQQAIDLQKEHRTALISAAVTGKIDVRGKIEIGQYEAA